MKIKAIFKGADSLGYFNGETYNLKFVTMGNKVMIIRITGDLKGYCVYDSLRSFLDNWDVV